MPYTKAGRFGIIPLILFLSTPVFATPDIAASDSTAPCTSSTLHDTVGPVTLQAEWGANTININWYADSVATRPMEVTNSAATTCTYDGAITLPENELTKTGYTFAGWQVRVPFDLSTLNMLTGGTTYGYSRLNGDTGSNESTYGLTTGSGEWATEFDYGTVKGMAKCSAKSGNNHDSAWDGNSADWLATESELTSTSGEAKYCWCKVTAFDAEKNGDYTLVTTATLPLWVYSSDYNSSYLCSNNCPANCAIANRYTLAFRRALYNMQ